LWAIAAASINSGWSLENAVSRFETNAVVGLKEMLPRLNQHALEQTLETPHAATAVFIYGTTVKYRDFVVPDKTRLDDIHVTGSDCPGVAVECSQGGVFFIATGIFDAVVAELARDPDIWTKNGIVAALNHLFEIEHNAIPRKVAPPVAILRIDKSGGLTWLQKGICD
jgi:hypothetical protein